MIWQRKPKQEKGVLIACDEKQEWLLPWWWENYSQENALPVTLVDLGMSKEARLWCEQHYCVIDFAFDQNFVAPKEKLSEKVASSWNIYGKEFWQARNCWFIKPLIMLQTDFFSTLWLDLDCEVLDSVDPLFNMVKEPFAIAREPEIHQGNPDLLLGEVLYNSGVVFYSHGSSLIEKWAELSLEKNAQFFSDQHLLSRHVFEKKIPLFEIPEMYNARLVSGVPFHAKIIHWVGSWGKEYIKKHGGLRKDLEILREKSGTHTGTGT
jgi:hypothetical protein